MKLTALFIIGNNWFTEGMGVTLPLIHKSSSRRCSLGPYSIGVLKNSPTVTPNL